MNDKADPERTNMVLEICRAQGFARYGVSDAGATEWADELIAWLEADKHSSMGYLKNHLAIRLDPEQFMPGVQSFVMVAEPYAPRGEAAEQPAAVGRIARYAHGRDYHKAIKRKLHAVCDVLREREPDESFRAFVDTAPVLEREYAQRACLGWVGKHTLLIDPVAGSYFFLGGIATTMKLEPEPERQADHCGSCTQCIDACPTAAITPYSVDGSKCISYLTIERRSAIGAEYFSAIGEWLFGCDICQEVCPHNSSAGHGKNETNNKLQSFDTQNEKSHGVGRGLSVLEILGWNEQARLDAFKGSAMKRATLAMMKRNAIIVAGNAIGNGQCGGLVERLSELAVDESEPEMVRETARMVLRGIEGQSSH